MQHLMSKEKFIDFKQKQWCTTFSVFLTLIPFVDLKIALVFALISAYSLLKCAKWKVFN